MRIEDVFYRCRSMLRGMKLLAQDYAAKEVSDQVLKERQPSHNSLLPNNHTHTHTHTFLLPHLILLMSPPVSLSSKL